jgi:SAM-dependent methyltransferase
MEVRQVGEDSLAGVVWEETPCPLCGARDEVEALRVHGTGAVAYRLVRCRACGMGYLTPRPNRATVGLLYPDDYGPHQARNRPRCCRGAWGWPARLERLARARVLGDPAPPASRAERALATLAAPFLLPGRRCLARLPYHGRGRVLDFGAGAGRLACQFQERGWDVTALDFSPATTRVLAQRYGLRTLTGSLPHPEVADGNFDVVVMAASLEHVHCPHEVVAAARRALTPGGLLVATVPNLDSAACRWLGPDWLGLDLPRHLLHFTRTTLTELMRRHGLEVVRLRTRAHSTWALRSLRNRRRRLGRAGSCWPTRAALAPVVGLLSRWAAWRGRGDDLHLVARRPPGDALPARAA